MITYSCQDKPPPTSGARSSRATQGEDGKQSGTFERSSINSRVNDVIEMVQKLTRLRPELERERDRRGKLMLELMGNIGAGCTQDITVAKLEIIINGEKVENLDVSNIKQNAQYLSYFGEEGSTAVNFVFTFGNASGDQVISFTNDENTNQLFTQGRNYLVPLEGESILVGGLEKITIKKEKPLFLKSSTCAGEQASAGCVARDVILEAYRYQLDSLEIKINGHKVYSKTDINHLFAETKGGDDQASASGLTWQDTGAQLNEKFATFLQRTDCSAL